MNIDEATTILGVVLINRHPYQSSRVNDALKLGIEALKLLENPTDPRLIYARKLLLGEIK